MDVAIVGNGPVSASYFDRIQNSDLVVRFNHPPKTHQYAGMKTDSLVISNSSKQTQELLNSAEYLDGPVFAGARSILLPYHPEIIRQWMPKPNIFSWLKGRRSDLTGLCERVAEMHGKRLEIIDKQTYLEVCTSLGISTGSMRKIFPSSGAMIIRHMLPRLDDRHSLIRLFGFGFQGWKHHDWNAEKRYVEQLSDAGKIEVYS